MRLLLQAVQVCQRKSLLLATAAELSLDSGDVRRAAHLYAESLASDGGGFASPGSVAGAANSLGDFFDACGELEGARWARDLQRYTESTPLRTSKIQLAVRAAQSSGAFDLAEEATVIYRRLRLALEQ